jgi:hypothetical protein
MNKKIDMGGFKNEEVDVVFGDDTYKIMLDPPIEATRMLIELQGMKMDSNEALDKFKEFIACLICNSNPGIDKDQFKKSLTMMSCVSFIDGYNALFAGKKKEIVNPSKNEVNPSQNY